METRKINYYDKSISQYREIRSKSKKKPKLLLHVCCGACSCYPLLFLHDLFDVTIFYSNSNIFPYEEFEKRLDALVKYVSAINEEFHKKINIIVDMYNYEDFKQDLVPYKDEAEHGNRCKICIAKRMERLFSFAEENGFNLVTTVMSISRNKNADYLNEIGIELAKKHNNVQYFVSDFKKNNGQDIGVALSKKYGIYRQEYCGCEFSKKE